MDNSNIDIDIKYETKENFGNTQEEIPDKNVANDDLNSNKNVKVKEKSFLINMSNASVKTNEENEDILPAENQNGELIKKED